MKITVPDSVLKEVAECPYNFSCLESGKCGDSEMCSVDYVAGKNILFLTAREHARCPYRFQFADRQICRCPMHYYLNQA